MPILLLLLGLGVAAVAVASSSAKASSPIPPSNNKNTAKPPVSVPSPLWQPPAISSPPDPGAFTVSVNPFNGMAEPGDQIQCFSSVENLKNASKLPDGADILVKYPSAEQPTWVFDSKGRWYITPAWVVVFTPNDPNRPANPILNPSHSKTIYSFMSVDGKKGEINTHCYVRSGNPESGSSNFLDSLSVFVTNTVLPLAATAIGLLVPVAAVPAALVVGAIRQLSSGAALNDVLLNIAARTIASQGGPAASAVVQDAIKRVSSNIPISELVNYRKQILDPTTLHYFDEGVALGVAKQAQDHAVSALKNQFPGSSPIVDTALKYGGSVYTIANSLGGMNAIKLMQSKIDEVRRAKSALPI